MRLRAASLSVVRLGPLRLGLRLGHVSAFLGLAVPSRAGTVVYPAVGIQTWPLLAGAGVARRLVAGAGVASWAGAFIGMVVASAAPHDCTPPWPRQAPARLAPLKGVPSLQVAVTIPVPCAWAAFLAEVGVEAGSIA